MDQVSVGQILVIGLVVAGCILLLDQLVLGPHNRIRCVRPLARATLLGGRVSDFRAWQSFRMGSRSVALDEERGILRIRSTWFPQVLLDLGLVTAITRPVRNKNDPFLLAIHYRLDEWQLPEEIDLTFDTKDHRDHWRGLLADGIKAARAQPRFLPVEHPVRPAPESGPAGRPGLL